MYWYEWQYWSVGLKYQREICWSQLPRIIGKLQRDLISFGTNLEKIVKNEWLEIFYIRVLEIFNDEHERSHSSFVENRLWFPLQPIKRSITDKWILHLDDFTWVLK